jgi:hypothetical protein
VPDGDVEPSFAGHTLVLAGVSNGNVGQLALECLLYTAAHQSVRVQRVGFLDSLDVLPVAGAQAFAGATQRLGAMCINLEVFQCAEKKLTILVQRATTAPGRRAAFVEQLSGWIESSRFASVVVLSGAVASVLSTRGPLMCLATSKMSETITRNRFDWTVVPALSEGGGASGASQGGGSAASSSSSLMVSEHLAPVMLTAMRPNAGWAAWTDNVWDDRMAYSGLTRLLLLRMEQSKMRALALVLPCEEGDNFSDGARMAAEAERFLGIFAETTPPHAANAADAPRQQAKPFAWVAPPSWRLAAQGCGFSDKIF